MRYLLLLGLMMTVVLAKAQSFADPSYYLVDSLVVEELEDFEPNKQPIGKYADPQPFTEHTVQLQEGDTI